MKRTILSIVNPLILLLLLFQLATALARGSNYEFFHSWHPIGGYSLVVLGLVHLALNLSWFKVAYRRRR